MTTTFTWSVPADGILTTNSGDLSDMVVQVRYVLTATDGVNTESLRGVVQLSPSDSAEFTPFENLTQAQVIDWVKSAIRPVDLDHYELALTSKLERKATPIVRPTVKPAPWNTCTQP